MGAKKLKQTKLTFKDLVRQNTGMHMMDSGFGSGRHWQQPLPADKIPFYYNKHKYQDGTEREYFYPEMPLHMFLDNTLEIDEKLTALLRKLQAENDSRDALWSAGAASMLAEELGLVDYNIADNSYNHENNLDQNFQFAVIGSADEKDHWFDEYNKTVLFLVETHNGADIRGGYSDVVVCRMKSGSFLDYTCDIRVRAAWDSNGEIVKDADCGGSIGDIRTERWEVGYSSSPVNTFGEDVKRVLSLSDDKTEMTVELNNGYFCTVYAGHRSEYC